ncbi:MAG: type II toxin-antitoxin system VapB family antitoxin [Burkholderiaceae bacterium]|jgi:Arc/MetJ family transcription regulator|nr:type II toxin-antitoxin system VapB family antitoxin [Burkholderiaceae bacterium]
MRTNIDIDDDLLTKAMHAGPYSTKKETVEAGLRLLARQAAYREVLKWEGKLKWEGDESIDWTRPDCDGADVLTAPLTVQERRATYKVTPVSGGGNKKAARDAGR